MAKIKTKPAQCHVARLIGIEIGYTNIVDITKFIYYNILNNALQRNKVFIDHIYDSEMDRTRFYLNIKE